MFSLAVKSASELMPVFARIPSGAVKPEDAVADAQKEYAQRPPQSAPAAPTTNMY